MTFITRKDAEVGTYELISKDARNAIVGGKQIVGVQALDFGQGDCNAVIIGSAEKPEPVVFCDVGGGKGPSGGGTHPWHESNGIQKKLRLGLCPTIIQSHWDADHYSTAVFIWQSEKQTTSRIVPGDPTHKNIYENCGWLVRRQRNGPSSTDFVRAVKNMVCWPENLPAHSFEIGTDMFLRVERCTGKNDQNSDRNLCGLAVRVINTGNVKVSDGGSKTKPRARPVPDQSASSTAIDHEEDGDEDKRGEDQPVVDDGDRRGAQADDPGDEVTKRVAKQILLPGDAPFNCLPSHGTDWSETNVTALFAYHHGSHTHLEGGHAIPEASDRGSTVVYTYGLKNGGTRCSYGHPHTDAVKAYEDKGWGKVETHRHAPAGSAKDPLFRASKDERQDCFVPFESASSSPKSATSESGSNEKAKAEADNGSSGASASKHGGPTTKSRRSVVIRRTT